MILKEKVCASIVLYNPDIQRLEMNLSAVCIQVGRVFIYDNGSMNNLEIIELIKNYENISYYHSKKNDGLSYALNYLCRNAQSFQFDWILTLDQDSIINENLIEEYLKYANYNIAQLTCYFKDVNIDANIKIPKEPIKVCWCITSGAFINLKIWEKVEGFDSKLFIDGIDYDYGITLNENGYFTLKIPYVGMVHEVGKISKVVRIFGKEHPVYNHSAFRKFYIARNAIYIARKHKSVSTFKTFFKTINRILFEFIYEKEKIKKTKSGIKGIIKGFKMEVK